MIIKIGADPELFVFDKQENRFISAHNMVPGNKENPFRVIDGAVQVDGMALEYNIDPVTSYKDFISRNNNVIMELKRLMANNGFWGDRYEISPVPVAHFGKEYIAAQPEEARILGCEPDYNAYTGKANPAPDGSGDFRTASGHIHIGWTEGMDPFDPDHFEACQMLTKQLDMVLGVGSRLWDYDTTRSSMYGRLGAFRPKPYGCEYRVLSNAWVGNGELMRLVFTMTKNCTQMLLEGKQLYNDKINWSNISRLANIATCAVWARQGVTSASDVKAINTMCNKGIEHFGGDTILHSIIPSTKAEWKPKPLEFAVDDPFAVDEEAA